MDIKQKRRAVFAALARGRILTNSESVPFRAGKDSGGVPDTGTADVMKEGV
ncbi:MAG: hypothetical protein LBF78_04610 [Treponema sp.]|jgi:hypothetical protein|nr:hypothetical protein [Treponema sp.]